ncbi:hypothetical protein G9A89_004266 [Geosiphon pyriformis]|nr:hypothetical protein G9A89_004266 [Geosiphon pyriformis]
MHLANLQATVTNVQDFEAAELKVNHAQAVNLVMNEFPTLSYQLSSATYQLTYLPMTQQPIYQPPIYQSPVNPSQPLIIYQPLQPQIIYQTPAIQTLPSNPAQMTSGNPKLKVTQNWRLVIVVHQPISSLSNQPFRSQQLSSETGYTQNPSSQNYLSLLVIPEGTLPNNWKPKQKQPLTNIPPATVMEDKSLAAIFPFKIKELTETLLFSRAALEKKLITAMYTDAKIDGQSIKLILNSGLAGSIITRQLMDQLGHRTLISEIDALLIEVNGIIVPIKYQTLINNDWLSKTHFSQNSRYTCVLATCGHFKPIEFEEEKEKPTWEAYQLPPILFWDNNNKRKQKKELTWNIDQAWETDNDQNKLANWKWKKTDKGKRKEKEKKTTPISSTYNSYAYTSSQPPNYCQPKLKCVDCGKRLSSMGACCGNNEEYAMDNQLCLTYETILPDKEMWNDIPGHGETCDETCQYTILINDWQKVQQLANYWKLKTALYLFLNPNTSKFSMSLATLRTTQRNFMNITKQKQYLKELNTQLCDHCLISCDFQYCNKCNLIYNSSLHMIYMILEEDKPISNYTSELESVFNPNSNFDNNDDKNTSSSSAQYGNKSLNNSDSNSNPEIYIVLLDLSKEQKLK